MHTNFSMSFNYNGCHLTRKKKIKEIGKHIPDMKMTSIHIQYSISIFITIFKTENAQDARRQATFSI